MEFKQESLEQCYNRISANSETLLNKFPNQRDRLDVLIKVVAGVSHMQQSALKHILNEFFTSTASELNLIRRGTQYGIYRKSSTFAYGEVKFKFNDDRAVIVPIGTILRDNQTSNEYVLEAVPNEQGISPVKALKAGAKSNCNGGIELQPLNPIEGVQYATVQGLGIVGGIDDEPLEEYRARIRFREHNPPHAGTASDYEAWAKEVEGVTRAWVQPHTPKAGITSVRFMTDNLTVDGFPTALKIAEVKEYLEAKSPTEATVITTAPKRKDVTIRITNVEPNRLDIKGLIEKRIKEFFKTNGNLGKPILWNRLNTVITSTPSLQSHKIIEPATDVQVDDDVLPVLESVNFG